MGSAAHGAAQPTELSDEPLPDTKGGNAASEHKGTLQQKRQCQGHVPATQAAGTGTPASPCACNSLPRGCKLLWVTHSFLFLIFPSRLNLILMSIKGGPKSTPLTWLLGSVQEELGLGSLISEISGGRRSSASPRLLPGHTAFAGRGWLMELPRLCETVPSTAGQLPTAKSRGALILCRSLCLPPSMSSLTQPGTCYDSPIQIKKLWLREVDSPV